MPGSAPHPRGRLIRAQRRASAALIATLCVLAPALMLSACGGSGSSSHSSTPTLPKVSGSGPQAFFTPGVSELYDNPVGTLETIQQLGIDRVDVYFDWNEAAPDANSRHKPSFDASDPAAYPATSWTAFDTVVREAAKLHLKLDVTLTGQPPFWASGKGAAGPGPASEHPYWEPNAHEFGQFVAAVGTRYSGHFTPKGAHSPLPRVDFWSIWNEPNLGTNLAPETVGSLHPETGGTKIEVAPALYRKLSDAAWTALHATGHGSDTVLIGQTAPVGQVGRKLPGNYAVMTPLRFIRALYCVGADEKPLTGQAAAQRQCPTSAAASKRFAAENPVLFKATAFSDHPYPQALPPDVKVPGQPDDAELGNIDALFELLDRTQQDYGSSRRLAVYDTEFGYQTNPPNVQAGDVSPARAAAWINWAEYITWRTPRLKSFDQYLLTDPPPVPGKKSYTRFASGLVTYANKPKPGYAAYRLPIFLPRTTGSKGSKLEVWGDIRPAKLVAMSRRAPGEIQFRASGSGRWKTVQRVSSRTPEGYFDVLQAFPSSGSVRLQWTPPGKPPIDSRTVTISLH